MRRILNASPTAAWPARQLKRLGSAVARWVHAATAVAVACLPECKSSAANAGAHRVRATNRASTAVCASILCQSVMGQDMVLDSRRAYPMWCRVRSCSFLVYFSMIWLIELMRSCDGEATAAMGGQAGAILHVVRKAGRFTPATTKYLQKRSGHAPPPSSLPGPAPAGLATCPHQTT